MRTRFLIGSLIAGVVLTGVAPAAAELTLARDGEALHPIIVAPNCSEETNQLADELAATLKQMTGATFDVYTGDGESGIVVGNLQEFPNPDLDEPLAVRNTYDGREAYAIRTEPDRLLLIGATDLSASHAVFRFLQSQGCRWFFPGETWAVIPETPTLTVDVDQTDRPRLLSRRIWYQWAFFDSQTQQDYAAWARRNTMAASMTVYVGHAWDHIIRVHQATFDAHPEYLRLAEDEDGNMTRGGNKLCVSNPDVQKLVADYAVEYFYKNPSADMVSVDPSDGGGHCECEPCKALGKVSNRVFTLANIAARAVQEAQPGKLVGLLAYNMHSEPPDFELEPNVYVQLTTAFIRGQYSFEELKELWPAKCRMMGFYDYYSVYQWNWDRIPGGNGSNVPRMQETIRNFIDHNATSIDAESGCNWGVHGRGYIVANALMWDPDTDVDALLADFYDKAFGPAAAVMQRYYERLDPGNDLVLSEHLLAMAYRDIQEACELAKRRPDVLARLDQLKSYLHYNLLRWQIDRAASDDVQRKHLTLAALTHAHRTRHMYMNHWAPMLQLWTTKAAEEFKEPSWSFKTRDVSHPWAVNAPYTRAEIDAMFIEGLDYFQPHKVEQLAFSDDLVPIRFEKPHRRDAVVSAAPFWQGAGDYVMYSVRGEPLKITVSPGRIEWYRDRADAKWTLTDHEGAEVATGRLKLDGEEHALRIKPPGAGRYTFRFNDSGAGWSAKHHADQPVTIPLSLTQSRLHHGHMPTHYFYVPKGTERIDLYWLSSPTSPGRPSSMDICGPDGDVIQNVNTSGRFVSIDVPKGTAGKVWQIKRFALTRLWFFNIPNYLSASPNSLLVPYEVAKKDRLRVLHHRPTRRR